MMVPVVQNDWVLVRTVEQLGTVVQMVAVVFETLIFQSRTVIALLCQSAIVAVLAYRLAVWAFASVALQ